MFLLGSCCGGGRVVGMNGEALVPELDRGFMAGEQVLAGWESGCSGGGGAGVAVIRLWRNSGSMTRWEVPLAGGGDDWIVRKVVKSLLWMRGGYRIEVDGPASVADGLQRYFSEDECGVFDAEMMGGKIYLSPFEVKMGGSGDASHEHANPIGRHLDGCRIGFDLGASDRKVAAVKDGEVVWSNETLWNPVVQKDPEWHFNEIMDSLKRAADHLPRVDAIGGSSAGVFVDNEVRVASLFRGVPAERFESDVRGIFKRVQKEWGGIPFEIINDGDVTALAGSMAIGENGILGIAMGSSMAAGYVDLEGRVNPWLNELAFCPVDWRDDAHRDEWSGDLGCGVQYFSQQAVARLTVEAGIPLPDAMPLPEKLVEVQNLMRDGDDRAAAIYRTIGRYLGWSIPLYRRFYDFNYLLILGRVMTGSGGDIILSEARNVLDRQFPDVTGKLHFHQPGEREKRHGQAIAAASLPELGSNK